MRLSVIGTWSMVVGWLVVLGNSSVVHACGERMEV